MQTPFLTIAILTRNRLPQLKKAVGGLMRQQPPPGEILIIDTGSTDGTREWAKLMAEKALPETGRDPKDSKDRKDQKDQKDKWGNGDGTPEQRRGSPNDNDPNPSEAAPGTPDPFPHSAIRIPRSPSPDPHSPPATSPHSAIRIPHSPPAIRLLEDSGRGAYAGARNRAVAAARGDLIAFLDDDCEPDMHWVRRILDRFAADPDLELLGGVTLPARALNFPDWWPPDLNWVLGLSVPGCWGPEAGRVHLGQTSNLAFRRRAWEATPFGELGEANFADGGAVYDSGREDVDWWRRLRRMGWKAEFDGKLIAWHNIPQARLDWVDALDRARRDGRSHWRRAGTRADIRAAASDVVHAPVRFASLVARRGVTAAQAARQVRLWTARQAALLDAAVTCWDKPLHPEQRAQALLVESARMSAGVGKWAARTVLATGHRALRHTRPIPSSDAPPASILVVSYGYMGDQLLIQPAMRLLRRAYPNTELILLTGRYGAEFYGESAPDADRLWFDRVIDADVWKDLPLPRRHARLHACVAELNPGAILLFYAHGLWPAPLFLAGDAPVIGHDRDQGFTQQLWSDLLTLRLEKDWSIHEVLNHARLVRALGAEGEIEPFTISIPDDVERNVDEALRSAGLSSKDSEEESPREFIVLHPSAGQRFKEWPAARWFQLAQWIEKETPFEVAFIGGRAERILAERFTSRGLRARNFCGWSLRSVAALLRRARLLISADSGPKHLAMAVRAQTLTLYGPTDERRWGALWNRDFHHELRRGLCDLTLEDLRGLPENWTMRLIEVKDVQETLTEILGWNRRSAADNVDEP